MLRKSGEGRLGLSSIAFLRLSLALDGRKEGGRNDALRIREGELSLLLLLPPPPEELSNVRAERHAAGEGEGEKESRRRREGETDDGGTYIKGLHSLRATVRLSRGQVIRNGKSR